MSQVEFEHFEYFIGDCSKYFAGLLDKDFWLQLVPQLSQTNSAIRYAVFAISCLHQNLARQHYSETESPSCAGTYNNSIDTSSAVFWYNKAIKAILAGMDESSGDQRMASISCVLFMCIECIQCHADQAFALYKQGERLIRSRKDLSSAEYGDLKGMFTRLRHMAMLFNCARPLLDPNRDDSGYVPTLLTPFDSLHEARDSLHVITASSHDFAITGKRPFRFSLPDPTKIEALKLQQIQHLTRLSEWMTRAHPLLHDPQLRADGHTHLTILMLLTHYHITMAFLPSALRPDETAFDAYYWTFKHVVDLTSQAIDLKNMHTSEPVFFTLEAGFIVALAITALHCRHLGLRRRAAELLRETPQQEGLWKAGLMKRVCERVIELEHAGSEDGEWPLEERRVRNAVVGQVKEDANGRKGHLVGFSRMPFGIEGEEEMWQEWFDA